VQLSAQLRFASVSVEARIFGRSEKFGRDLIGLSETNDDELIILRISISNRCAYARTTTRDNEGLYTRKCEEGRFLMNARRMTTTRMTTSNPESLKKPNTFQPNSNKSRDSACDFPLRRKSGDAKASVVDAPRRGKLL